jgi:hypothetical protein
VVCWVTRRAAGERGIELGRIGNDWGWRFTNDNRRFILVSERPVRNLRGIERGYTSEERATTDR